MSIKSFHSAKQFPVISAVYDDLYKQVKNYTALFNARKRDLEVTSEIKKSILPVCWS
jgi:hypothetical protein